MTQSGVFYVIKCSEGYLIPNRGNYKYEWSDQINNAHRYKSLTTPLGTFQDIGNRFNDLCIVRIEASYDESSIADAKELYSEYLDEYTKLRAIVDVDVEQLSDTKWKRFKKLNTLLGEMNLIEPWK